MTATYIFTAAMALFWAIVFVRCNDDRGFTASRIVTLFFFGFAFIVGFAVIGHGGWR